ncbi:50S ribosomal protein L18e [Nanoarchaeota archaeon]
MEKNPQMAKLVQELKKSSIEQGVGIWKRVAEDLEKPSRKRREVNIYLIDRIAKDGETLVVPGKVLGTGELGKKVKVAALNFSDSAYSKIKAKGEALTLLELMKKNPKGKDVRILG